MQYHLNRFRTGDPSIVERTSAENQRAENVDVLIIGCGPAGLTLAAQLSEFSDIRTRIVERKSGPLEMGQADGIACRSVEMFEAFGFSEKVLKEAYYVNEVAFWRPLLTSEGSSSTGLHRADLIQDVEDDLSEMPHVILSQARVHDFYLEKMINSAIRLTPDYNRELVDLTRVANTEYPLAAKFICDRDANNSQTINAKYVVGCDGARSVVRKTIGQQLKGESARQLWGVMDILAVTDFPDIRKKAAIQSADNGSLLIIPREGGYLVRMYIELSELHGNERASDVDVTPESLADKARAILSPFTLEVKQVVWWSAYEIGQRVCDIFDNIPNEKRENHLPDTFIAGDACHTHSPKAGQGMNVGMADAFNLGWKLAAVIRGQSKPSLLHSYSQERQAKALELINFDKDMAKLFSNKPKDTEAAQLFQQYFKKHARYTAGVETQYSASNLTQINEYQQLAKHQKVGMRFHSELVVRLSDAKQIQLGHTIKADGRWRLFAFGGAGDNGQTDKPTANLCRFLSDSSDSPIIKFTPNDSEIDSVFDVRAVFQAGHRELAIETMPALLLPLKGSFNLIDYEKVFCAMPSADIYDARGIDRKQGALIIIRPDQYIACVLPLNDYKGVAQYFDRIMIPA
ncbi:MAG: FAD-dependent monooxygenase [Granulosicoccus sp.]